MHPWKQCLVYEHKDACQSAVVIRPPRALHMHSTHTHTCALMLAHSSACVYALMCTASLACNVARSHMLCTHFCARLARMRWRRHRHWSGTGTGTAVRTAAVRRATTAAKRHTGHRTRLHNGRDREGLYDREGTYDREGLM
jgi:hypothetical protein